MSINADFNAFIIRTENMHSLSEFYRKAFELPELKPTGDDHLGVSHRGVYIGFDLAKSKTIEHPGGVVPWVTVDNIQTTFDRMVELGATVNYAPKEFPWGETLASLNDPDGNEIGLIERLRDSK